ncbi:MAG: DUF4380 domain-containing protein [Nitrospiraceae bacterium]
MALTQVDQWGWRGLKLAAGRVALVATPEVGGRVTSLSFDDSEIFFTLPALRGRRVDLDQTRDARSDKRALGWLHYGGYKTWLAPQERWTDGLPFVDLDSGCYEYECTPQTQPGETLVRVTSPVCRETGLQLTRSIVLSEGGHITVEQSMANRSTREVAWGLWDVTQLRGPGTAILPIRPDSQFTSGVKAYLNEGRSQDVMDRYVVRKDQMAIVTCHQVEPFKYGTDSHEGWILALLDCAPDRWLAYLKLFQPIPGAIYPHESVTEVYDSGTHPYFEVEVHSPLQRLVPGASYGFTEAWVVDWLPKTADPSAVREWVARVLTKARK